MLRKGCGVYTKDMGLGLRLPSYAAPFNHDPRFVEWTAYWSGLSGMEQKRMTVVLRRWQTSFDRNFGQRIYSVLQLSPLRPRQSFDVCHT